MVITRLMRRLTSLLSLAALSLLLLTPARLAADLIWTPQEGWRVEGGVLAGLGGEDGRNALDLMNKARTDILNDIVTIETNKALSLKFNAFLLTNLGELLGKAYSPQCRINAMILLGVLFLGAMIWVVIVSLPAPEIVK